MDVSIIENYVRSRKWNNRKLTSSVQILHTKQGVWTQEEYMKIISDGVEWLSEGVTPPSFPSVWGTSPDTQSSTDTLQFDLMDKKWHTYKN